MLQVLQYQKTGKICVEEMPDPICPENGILVKNLYSLISAGTERSSVEKAQSSMLSRIKKQPEDVKLVLEFVKKEGIRSTLNRVQNKLDSFKVLGYSSAGIILESGCSEFVPGDRVACAGAGYANHAEIVAIPKNLAAKIPENVDYESAAYTTLASIAMQGVRQASPNIGDNIAVVGLGLIGLITIQILKSNGVNVIGIDITSNNFELARQLGAERTILSNSEAIDICRSFSNGMLMDSVIIAAATDSNQPIELSLNITRKRGSVIILGAIGMDIPRTPFYMKEIELKIATSYGPGRYDSSYEELGIDYPYPYVRWTENRNMQAILKLLANQSLDFKKITTHTFDLKEAESAYDLITGKVSGKYLGILLKYDNKSIDKVKMIKLHNAKKDKIGFSFVGLGTFAQNHLLPNIINTGISPIGVANQNPATSKSVAEKNKFAFFSTDYKEIINNSDTDIIFCATRHDTHSKIVVESIKAKKPIFVEKPLAINREQLDEIITEYKNNPINVMCGFNRRFSDSFTQIKSFFEGNNYPLTMVYRINAGFIPKDNWIQHPNQGGRIIGEVCHFIDTLVYISGSYPFKIFAECVSSNSSKEIYDRDNIAINIKFANGSIGTIIYTATGSSNLPKEYFEVHSERKSAIMNNFESINLISINGNRIIKMNGDKGIRNEVSSFIDSVKLGKESPIKFEEIVKVTESTFAILESLEIGRPIFLN